MGRVRTTSGRLRSSQGASAIGKIAHAEERSIPLIPTDPDQIPIESAVSRDSLPTYSSAKNGKVLEHPNEPAIGSLDRVDHEQISGWAWDPAKPDEAVNLEILDGDTVICEIAAAEFREDLLRAGIGNGCHAFFLRGLQGIFPLSRHRVRIRRAGDGSDLPGSPCWITRTALDSHAIDFIDQAVGSAIVTASRATDLAQPLAQFLGFLGKLINAHDGLAGVRQDDGPASALELASQLSLDGRMGTLIGDLRRSYLPIHFDSIEEPIVSIVIPVHNKFSYTYNCVRSIQEILPKRSYEVIVVDDASDDETLLAGLVFSGGMRLLRIPVNLGFVGSSNAGAAAARGKYLFFLNNDTLVKEGWLDELVDTFDRLPDAGIVGSRLLFEDGRVQEAGGIIWRLGDAWKWGGGRDPDDPAISFLRDVDYVSGAALMIERKLFEEIGGFDVRYAPAYYEDVDLAFRVRARGKRVLVQPASQIVHFEGVSCGTDVLGPGLKRYQVINHSKFYQRWKDTLATHRFSGEHPEQEAERRVYRCAYFIDDSVPTPDQDAGSNAAIAHIKALMELGYKVVFLPADNMTKLNPYTADLQKIGIECLYSPFYSSVEDAFRKARVRPDLIYLHRHNNASLYANMVHRYFPGCRTIYSVADLHFLRLERQAKIEGSKALKADAARRRREELGAMESVSCVVVHSPYEAELLREMEPSVNVQVVPWTVIQRPVTQPFSERSGIAFVGGFGHPPNLDAARYLTTDILPLLWQRLPDCTAYLVGSKLPDELARQRNHRLVPLGFVPNLADILHKLRCTVAPLRFGAGIKGKVLESFAHGLPCVMSEIAAEGLELPKKLTWLVARSPGDFADKLERLHSDPALNHGLSEAGLAYIGERYSAQAVKAALAVATS